ncbi:sulfite exporter TauE/SafE family protein [Flocculibacter collagenilyticus]|uniref:sulfite exporter TauE/SafE family protein n=1 Tax=Flocculibacter collagenilyticus TaxID=2744479 RepID=UPI0018F29204|nr:sulfite exporter TauE/SafE family protein [Flocculibacter collagenilyticus]
MTDFIQLFISAFVIGLLGGAHCVGMCGGVVNALSFAIPAGKHPTPYLLLYNFGRIISYIVAGTIVGAFSASILTFSDNAVIHLRFLSSLFLILVGLYIAKWWSGLLMLEKAGKPLWRIIKKLNKYVVPVKSYPRAFLYGAIWGWLPCGLVYSTLTWSLTTGSSYGGATIMLGFGLGTLPAVLGLGYFSGQLNQLLAKPLYRSIAGVILIMWGTALILLDVNQLLL